MTLAALLPICGFAWTGWYSYIAAKHYAQYMVAAQGGNAPAALAKNYDAYTTFPLDPMYRRQLVGSLTLLIHTGGDKVRVEPSAADQIARIGMSVGSHDPSVLLPRVEYLMNFGRWREPEMAELMRRLESSARMIQSYWLLAAYWHGHEGRKNEALEAVANGLLLPAVNAQVKERLMLLKTGLESIK